MRFARQSLLLLTLMAVFVWGSVFVISSASTHTTPALLPTMVAPVERAEGSPLGLPAAIREAGNRSALFSEPPALSSHTPTESQPAPYLLTPFTPALSAPAGGAQLQSGGASVQADMPQSGPVFTVNQTADTADGTCGTDHCSLREAVIAANAYNSGANPAIILPAGEYVLSIAGTGEEFAASGDLDIRRGMIIQGYGMYDSIINANGIDRALDLFASVAIYGLTVTGGRPAVGASGGGIRVSPPPFGDIILHELLIVDNQTTNGHGGGIYFGTSYSASSIFSTVVLRGNSAINGNGGGLAASISIYIDASEISGNSATDGGGIWNPAQYLDLHNTTVSTNTATQHGGGIYASGQYVILDKSTITANVADSDSNGSGDGGGLYTQQNPEVNVDGSILYGNVDRGGQTPECSTTLLQPAASLFGNLAGCTLSQPQDNLIIGQNPQLGALQPNGGLTWSHMPASTSPVIGQLSRLFCQQADQNGLLRVNTSTEACDLGAVEHRSNMPPAAPNAGMTVYTNGTTLFLDSIFNGSLSPTEVLIPVTMINVTFSRLMFNPAGDSAPNDITNPANYLLVSTGSDGIINTTACEAISGDDQPMPLGAITYQHNLNDYYVGLPRLQFEVNGGTALPDGLYRLFICDALQRAVDGLSFDGDWNGQPGGDARYTFWVGEDPTAPQNLRVTAAGWNEITLVWDSGSLTPQQFRIERAGANYDWTEFATVDGALLTATDSGLQPESDYLYRIRADFGGGQFSTYSNEVYRRTEPEPSYFVVNTPADGSDGACTIEHCTLREAVIAANAYNGGAGGATVEIPAGTYTLSVAGVNEDAAATGDLDLTASMTIIGANRDTTIIDASQIDRVLHIVGEVTVNISGVTVRGGLIGHSGNPLYPYQSGAGILVETGQLNLTDAIVTDNEGTGENGGGGIAIANGEHLHSHASATITNSIIINNQAISGGGIIILSSWSADPITITNSQILNNTAQHGAGIYNEGGTLVISGTTIASNEATGALGTGEGGGGIANTGILTIENSVIANNTANVIGGGLYDVTFGEDITSEIRNTTISGNSAQTGGGIYRGIEGPPFPPSPPLALNLSHVTIANNTATVGTQIYLENMPLNTSNSIIAGTGTACVTDNGTITQQGVNLASDVSCGFALVADPLLAPLADNGGGTFTHALLPDSPVLNAADAALCATTDQRGENRPEMGGCDLGAFEEQDIPQAGPVFVVNMTTDSADGVCGAHCSLREAVIAANAYAGADVPTVSIPAGTYLLTILGEEYWEAEVGDLNIMRNMVIAGADAATTIIDAQQQDHSIFGVWQNVTLTVQHLTLTNSDSYALYSYKGYVVVQDSRFINNYQGIRASGDGTSPRSLLVEHSEFRGHVSSGISAHNVHLTVDQSAFVENGTPYMTGADANGGGISMNFGGTLTITNSLFAYNRTTSLGGGLYIDYSASSLVSNNALIENTTFYSNTAASGGAAFITYWGSARDIRFRNVTIANNLGDTGAGGIHVSDYLHPEEQVRVQNSIIYGNYRSAGTPADFAGSLISAGYNIIGSDNGTGIGGDQTGVVFGVNPLFGPLADHGGSTFTLSLYPGSPAVDVVDSGLCPPLDQRGISRPQGVNCDLGAYESDRTITDAVQNGPIFTVTAVDNNDDGSCTEIHCTLVEAIHAGNAYPGAATIRLTHDVSLIRIVEDDPTYGKTGLPAVSGDLTLEGNGYTISRFTGGTYRIFRVTTEGKLTLDNVVVTRGIATGSLVTLQPNGNAVFNEGELILRNNTRLILNGRPTGGAETLLGGAIYNAASGTVSISDSSIENNEVRGDGGGIYNLGTLTIIASTLSGNRAIDGCGIYNDGGTVTIVQSLFLQNSTNSGRNGGAIYNAAGGTVTVTETTFQDNINYYSGGAVFNEVGSTVSVDTSLFYDNMSFDLPGGAISNYGTLSLTNSTVARTRNFYDWGALYNGSSGTMTVTSSTITDNSGGLQNASGTLTIINSIVANNFDYDSPQNCYGTITALGVNVASDDTCGFDLVLDPQLAPLVDNGGSTLTHALLPDSPLLGIADEALCPATDQRGITRPQGNGCDVGAFESSLAPLFAPLNVRLVNSSADAVELAWDDASTDETAFYVERRAAGAQAWTRVAEPTANSTTFVDSAPLCGTAVDYRVLVYRSSDDRSLEGDALVNVAAVPCAPQSLTVEVISTTEVLVSWQPPQQQVTGYQLQRSPNGVTDWVQIAVLNTDTLSFLDQGLICQNQYFYRVRAVASAATSAYSSATSAILMGCHVVAPTALRVTGFTDTQVDLRWSDNSGNESSFHIERAEGGAWAEIAVLPPNTQVYSDISAQCSTAYQYRVRAEIGATFTDYTETSIEMLPCAPTHLTAEDISRYSAALHWNITAPSVQFTSVERREGAGEWSQITQFAGIDEEYLDSSLQCETTYSYRVRVSANDSYSVYSNEVTITTLACALAAPTDLVANLNSDGMIEVTWTDNAVDEDAYLVFRSLNGVNWTLYATVDANATHYVDHNALCNVTYHYYVQAYRSSDGVVSQPSAADSAIKSLCAPSQLTTTVTGMRQVRLTWTDNSSGQATTLIERSADGGTNWTQLTTVQVGVATYNDNSVVCATTYHYRVRSIRGADSSGYSNISSVFVPDCSLPPPENVVAQLYVETGVTLTWTDTNTSETSYVVERSEQSADLWLLVAILPANSTTHLDLLRECGRDLRYRIRAERSSDNTVSEYSVPVYISLTPCTPQVGDNVVVNVTTDVNDNLCTTTHCTLREAIAQINIASDTQAIINFNILGGAPYTISLQSALPPITRRVLIDGWSHPDFVGTPIIVLNGANAGVNVTGLEVRGHRSIVRGLVIQQFTRDGLVMWSNYSTVEGNYIGVDVTGALDRGNNGNGMIIYGIYSVIGGTLPQQRNVISGNGNHGLWITGAYNTAQGNYIGVSADGTARIANGQNGIMLEGSANLIGGTVPGAANVVSGNGETYINSANIWAESQLAVNAIGNTIQGNIIGTNAAGTASLSTLPHAYGIVVRGSNILIGGTTPGAGNLISGNYRAGILVGSRYDSSPASANTRIQSNLIGTDITGTQAIPNSFGIMTGSGVGTLVGGIEPGAGNLISGNRYDGIEVIGNATVQGNRIGVTADMTATLGNENRGIAILRGNVVIGGTAAGAGNVIGGNLSSGIHMYNAFEILQNIRIEGNFIGTDPDGTRNLGNATYGISTYGEAAGPRYIGGMAAGAGNTIAFNGSAGVYVQPSDTRWVSILGNRMYDNGGLGIELGLTGVNNNDPLDPDGGANGYQNFPIINRAYVSGQTLTLKIALNSKVNSSYHVELFASPTCDASGNGEGAVFIAATTLTTDSSGSSVVELWYASDLPAGWFITATATAGDGSTSEFSPCRSTEAAHSRVAVTGLTASAVSQTALALNWQQSDDDETGYRIERSADGVSNWVNLAELAVNATAYTDNTLACGTTYHYRVVTLRGADTALATSDAASGMTQLCDPDAPGNLVAAAGSPFQIDLTWTDSNSDETSYIVEHSADGVSGWTELASLPADSSTYSHSDLLCATTHYYRVRAFRAVDSRYSAYSSASASTTCLPLVAPSDLVAVPTDESVISLAWTDNDSTETGYVVEYALSGSSQWALLDTLPADSTSYDHSNLSCGVGFVYRVRAMRSRDNASSAYSNTAESAPPPCAPPAPPQVPQVAEPTQTQAALSWQPPANMPAGDVTAVHVERAPLNGDWREVAVLPGTATTYLDQGLVCGTAYQYRVRTYRVVDNRYSDYSTVITIITDDCPPNVTHTVGLYSAGIWEFRDSNTTGPATVRFAFGPRESGWQPLVGDWDGDGSDGLGLYKDGIFLLRNAVGAGVQDIVFNFGSREAGWQAVAGDWNGDGVDTVGVYKNGLFRLTDSSTGSAVHHQFAFGPAESGWLALAGDWGGIGADRVGLYRAGTYLLSYTLTNNSTPRGFTYGPAEGGWLPVVGDWNQDGTETIGLYRGNIWRLRNSNSAGGADVGFNFGVANDTSWLPIASYRGGMAVLTVISQGLPNPLDISATPLPEVTPDVVTPEVTPEITPTQPPLETTPEASAPTELPAAPPTQAAPTEPPPATETPLPPATEAALPTEAAAEATETP